MRASSAVSTDLPITRQLIKNDSRCQALRSGARIATPVRPKSPKRSATRMV
jgi:hypothetical protein